MITLPMTVTGYGDLYAQYFNAIVLVFGKEYQGWLQITEILAGFTVLISLVFHRDLLGTIKWLFYFYLLIYVLFLPRVNLEIVDTTKTIPYRVANVPLGLGIIASVSSQLSYQLTQSIEMKFSMPDELLYTKYGMVFSAQLMKAATEFEITDARIDANMQSFVERCVFYDLWFKKYSLKDLVTANDIWAFLGTQKMSPVRGFMYTESNTSKFTTCKDSFPLLEKDWIEALKSAGGLYGTRIFHHDVTNSAATLSKYLPISYSFLTKLADAQADTLMRQMMMSNTIERSALHMGAKVDANAALKSYSFVRAQAQKRMTNQTVAELASYWLPLIKISIELILYGSFIFVLLIPIFPFGQKTLKGYLFTMLWIQLWPPVFALFHLIVSYMAQSTMSASLTGGLSMQNIGSMSQLATDMMNLAGYMSMMVPGLSAFILWGSHHYIGQMGQYIGGVAQSASSQAATELASGNISLGNTSLGNHNAFNTAMNKYDTNMRVAGGAKNLQLMDGSELTQYSGGHDVLNMQSAISNLPLQFDLNQNYRTGLVKSAEHAENASKQSFHSFSHNVTANARDVNSLSRYESIGQANSESYSSNVSSGVNNAFSEIRKVNEEVSEKLGLSHQEAEALTASLYFEGKANASFGPKLPGLFSASVGGGAGTSRQTSNTDSNNKHHSRDEAKAIMDAHHYSENVDLVNRAIKDNTFRASTDVGKRLTADISHSLDVADSSRQDANVNLQKADYLRKTANISEENGVAYRDNLSQEFMEFVASQPNQYGSGSNGVENVNTILSDPHRKEEYVNEFMKQKIASVESHWQGLPKSTKDIETIYKKDYAQIGNDQHINAIEKFHTAQLKDKSDEMKLNLDDPVNNEVRIKVENEIHQNKLKVENEKISIDKEHQVQREKHQTSLKNYDRSNIAKKQVTGVKEID